MAVKLYANVDVMEVGDVDFAEGYALYDARYVLKAGDTLTGPLLLHGGSNALQLKVKGHSSQSASLQEWQSSSAAVLAKVASDGALTIGSSSDLRTYIGPAPDADGYHYNLRYTNSDAWGGLMKLYWSRTDGVSGGVHYILDASAVLSVNSGKTASQMSGLQFFLTKNGAGEINYLRGALFRMEAGGSSYSNDVYGLQANLYAADTAILQRGYAFHIQSADKASGATFNDNYGLYIEDQTIGASKNYAIYTNAGDVRLMASGSDKIGFHGATPVAQQTVTGSRGGNAALASLLTKLANLGIIVDSSS